jgi:hypothetical protein
MAGVAGMLRLRRDEGHDLRTLRANAVMLMIFVLYPTLGDTIGRTLQA